MNSDEYQFSAVIYDHCISPLLKGVRQDIRTYINYKGYKRIIDFCCGTGAQLRLLDSPEMTLCGIDNSLSMLEQARSKCSRNIELHLLDAEHDKIGRESFDCAIISFGLHEKHPAVADSVFKNCRKTIRQGGSLILADYSDLPSSFQGKAWGAFMIPLIERLAGTIHHEYYQAWMQQGGLEGFLEKQQAGCEIISRPFGNAVLCCAINIDDEARSKHTSYALLNRTLNP